MSVKDSLFKNKYSLPQEDLSYIFSETRQFWSSVDGKNLFLTGGTGFFGVWIVESFVYAREQMGLSISLTVLTRSTESLKKRLPHLFDFEGVRFFEGDVRNFKFPSGQFTHVIHAATSIGTESQQIAPINEYSTIVQGTQHVLEFAKQAGTQNFLLVSSGAVYGSQPSEVRRLTEDYLGSPDTLMPSSTYGESKRMAEHLASIYARECSMKLKVIRPFALLGPYLPLASRFAIGNFLNCVLKNQAIEISGDGTPLRSYMYAADLTCWLWTVFFAGKTQCAYNVGSEEEISISDLATLVSTGPWCSEKLGYSIAKVPDPARVASRYVPSTHRARQELDLRLNYTLTQGIDSTLKWLRERK